MAFIDRVAPRHADGEVHAMYLQEQKHWGFVPNYAKAFCHRPELMNLWVELLGGVCRHVDRRRFELVTFAAAHALGSSYCSLAHSQKLTRYFSSSEILTMVGDCEDMTEPLTEAERAMMAYARTIARDATQVTVEDVAVLRAHGFSEAEIFDIAAIAAARSFLTKVMDALGVQPDSSFLEMDEAFRHSMTVGRPVDPNHTEQVELAAKNQPRPAVRSP